MIIIRIDDVTIHNLHMSDILSLLVIPPWKYCFLDMFPSLLLLLLLDRINSPLTNLLLYTFVYYCIPSTIVYLNIDYSQHHKYLLTSIHH